MGKGLDWEFERGLGLFGVCIFWHFLAKGVVADSDRSGFGLAFCEFSFDQHFNQRLLSVPNEFASIICFCIACLEAFGGKALKIPMVSFRGKHRRTSDERDQGIAHRVLLFD